ncbi:uncharacterized protein LOC122513140 [Leptopilina heterotoma]|uniref:uncharacterized protein LOC122513140 n=1 Tax=Leptopilina heterotoma TaxID=63436 RepID=UPI001CA887D0|nr:uncharacterized protein LOC122513140 [Leptopilina heterotoma]
MEIVRHPERPDTCIYYLLFKYPSTKRRSKKISKRQKSNRGTMGSAENRDSGVADVEVCSYPGSSSERSETTDMDNHLKRSALSNSLLDIHEQCELYFSQYYH